MVAGVVVAGVVAAGALPPLVLPPVDGVAEVPPVLELEVVVVAVVLVVFVVDVVFVFAAAGAVDPVVGTVNAGAPVVFVVAPPLPHAATPSVRRMPPRAAAVRLRVRRGKDIV